MSANRSNPVLAGYAVAAIAFLYAPLLVLLVFSFNDALIVAFPLKGFTLQWYHMVIDDGPLLDALRNSLGVASVTSIIATVLGIFGAKAVTRYRFPGRKFFASMIVFPLFIPEIVLSISLLALLLNIGLPSSLTNVMIGHVVYCTPFAVTTLISRFSTLDPSLEEAALDLGEGPWMTFVRVTLVLILPGIVSSLLLTFLLSFDEFLLAFFLVGSDTTLPVYLYTQLRFPEKLPEMLALGVMIIAISIILVVIAEYLQGERTKKEA